MIIPEHLRFKMRGFSPLRLARVLAMMSIGLVPIHPCVSCDVSGGIATLGIVLVAGAAILSFSTPRGTPERLRALRLGLVAFVLHLLAAH